LILTKGKNDNIFQQRETVLMRKNSIISLSYFNNNNYNWLALVCLIMLWSTTNVIAFITRTSSSVVLKTSRRAAFHSSSSTLLRGKTNYDDYDEDELLTGYKRPAVQWYPGHIAKAERQLSETLKSVDVIVEVRDARACKATSHSKVAEWCAGRPRIVVLTHVDKIPKLSIVSWKRSYETFGAGRWDGEVNSQVFNQAMQKKMERSKYRDNKSIKKKKKNANNISNVDHFLFVNAKMGQGIHALNRAILKAGAHIQERRGRRGLKDRALRVGVIGYPNVGKSALINRILNRRRARTANTPGITRTLQWIRVKTAYGKTTKRGEFELLDSPGVIPARITDQSDAFLLAACNCIGNNAYDNQGVASYLFEWIKALHVMGRGKLAAPDFIKQCEERYDFHPINDNLTGESMLYKISEASCRGSIEDASRKMLQDFRTGRLGPICLQLAPLTEDDDGQQKVTLGLERQYPGGVTSKKDKKMTREDYEQERLIRAANAIKSAQERGLELPPIIHAAVSAAAATNDDDDSQRQQEMKPQEVGKGLFDGW